MSTPIRLEASKNHMQTSSTAQNALEILPILISSSKLKFCGLVVTSMAEKIHLPCCQSPLFCPRYRSLIHYFWGWLRNNYQCFEDQRFLSCCLWSPGWWNLSSLQIILLLVSFSILDVRVIMSLITLLDVLASLLCGWRIFLHTSVM